jgi:hypothetical protein
MPWTLPMAFVDDVAAGHRHHHDATSCQSRKTKASRIKIVVRSSKSGKAIFITTYSHHQNFTIVYFLFPYYFLFTQEKITSKWTLLKKWKIKWCRQNKKMLSL